MITANRNAHDECWLVLPWLATGRLAGSERALAEEHLRTCSACALELERQQQLCTVLTEPERVTHAPGPSFRKLMERIDGLAPARPAPARPVARTRSLRPVLAATWRPPGLAWAATFVFAVGVGLLTPTFYRWSQPAYSTYTSTARRQADVLHVAFERSLTLGEVTQLLRSSGARIVEGPDGSGIFGVAPVNPGSTPDGVSPQLRALAQHLQSDARVRWLEPLPQDPAGSAASPPAQP
ncbi:MAG TPA: hypothetical protein VGI91_02150 [Steroidobacteraceae bacterium]|jgi:hypothetical protein